MTTAFQCQRLEAAVHSSERIRPRRRTLFLRCAKMITDCRSVVAVAGLLCAVAVFAALPRTVRGADNRCGPASTTLQSAAPPGISANSVTPSGKAAAACSTSTSQPAASGAATFTGNKLSAISANPGATNLLPGTGLLGRLIGFGPNSGVGFGGLWIGNADYLVTGGVKPWSWSFNSLLILNLNLDIKKLIGLPGSSVDVSMLQFNGENASQRAGVVQGYDGLPGPKPLVRTQLYELWWRQSLFAGKLVIRVGKTVPTYDFNNVSRPIAVSDESLTIPSVTGLIYTPIFKNPTLIGAAPGYYNSAYGITANIAPTLNSYFTYAVYDGALATGDQTGLDASPVFSGHYFTIAEAGHAWLLGQEAMPGKLAVGGWAQTGTLEGPGVRQNGAQGLYTFGSQRNWLRHPGIDNSGVSGFYQFGFNDSNTMIANRYFGLGFTGFGLVHGRSIDSMGVGLAWSWLNRRYGFRSNEAMLQAYYQAHLIGASFLEPVISYIPNPGDSPRIQGAVATTAQLTVLF
jgi:porin